MPVLKRKSTASSTVPRPPTNIGDSNGSIEQSLNPARSKIACSRFGVSERVRTRRPRRAEVGRRNVREGSPDRHRHPVVRRQLLPHCDGNASSRSQRPADVRERGDRIVEEHHPEAADRAVEDGFERTGLRVVDLEGHVLDAFGARGLPRPFDHRFREVDAERSTVARGPSRQPSGRAAPASDVEHLLGGGDRRGFEHGRAEGLEHLVVAALLVDPVTRLVAVPVRALVRVRCGHGRDRRPCLATRLPRVSTGTLAGMSESQRRRLDLMLEPAYLDGLSDLTMDEVQTLHEECLDVETELSYVRRLAQARIDIVEAELDRRAEGGTIGDLVAALPDILAREVAPRTDPVNSRLPQRLAPDPDITFQRGLERLVTDATLVNLPSLPEPELRSTLEQLHQLENEVSEQRRGVHEVIDLIEAQITERYKVGRA